MSLEQVLDKMKSLEEINNKLVKENKQITDWMDNDSNTIEDLTAQLETAQKKINDSEQVFMSSLGLKIWQYLSKLGLLDTTKKTRDI